MDYITGGGFISKRTREGLIIAAFVILLMIVIDMLSCKNEGFEPANRLIKQWNNTKKIINKL